MKIWLSMALAAAAVATVHADMLTQWTFETSVPTTAGPLAPEFGSGSATGSHASSSTAYSNPVGNGSMESFSSNFWAVGDYYQFQTSTSGYSGVIVNWDQTASSSGPGQFQFQYSTNGSTFTNFGSVYSVAAVSWSSSTGHSESSYTADLSGISALDNQANVYFRLIDTSTASAGGGTVGTSGSNRVDNFTVNAAPVPEPASMAALGLGALGILKRRRRK